MFICKSTNIPLQGVYSLIQSNVDKVHIFPLPERYACTTMHNSSVTEMGTNFGSTFFVMVLGSKLQLRA